MKDESIIGICAAILLRHHNPQMNLVLRIVSLLLYSGHAPKLVSTIGYTLSQVCTYMTVSFTSGVSTSAKDSVVSFS